MVNISESTYSSYLTYNGNFANFEYYTLSGNTLNILPAWIESNNAGKLITWVKLPKGIPAESNTIIYLGFASTSNNLLSSTGTTGIGEAPQLPCGSTATSSCSTYAEYDDGTNVFNFYDNFIGTSLSSQWGNPITGGPTYTINNGLTFTASSSNTGGIILPSALTYSPSILETYISTIPVEDTDPILGYETTAPSPTCSGTGYYSCNSFSARNNPFGSDFTVCTTINDAQTCPGVSGFYSKGIYSFAWPFAGTESASFNYSQILTESSTALSYSPSYLSLSAYLVTNAGSITYQYVRTRAYPPNGVMPSATFGVIQGGSPSVTVSPSSVSVPSGTSFTLTANVNGGTSPYTYQWYNATSGILITGATSSTYTTTAGSTAGTFEYYVKVTDSESKTVQSSNSVVTVSLPPSGVTYYVPITLTNSQSSNTPYPFQQMVNISESSFSSYLTYNGNFANFEFFTSSGTVIPAWIESDNSGKLITWVNLPNGIPADSNTIIYLGFASNTVNLLSSSGTTGIGEAPQLPCGSTATGSCSTYAEYDDGASVFNFYDNFIGTSLSSQWSSPITGGITFAVNNGLTFTATTSTTGIILPSASTYSPSILETYVSTVPISNTNPILGYETTAPSSTCSDTGYYSCNSYSARNNVGGSTFTGSPSYQLCTTINDVQTCPSASGDHSKGIYSLAWPFTGTESASFNYSQILAEPSTSLSYGASYLSLSAYLAANAGSITYQYVRTRAYPPNGAMPTVAFGNGVTV